MDSTATYVGHEFNDRVLVVGCVQGKNQFGPSIIAHVVPHVHRAAQMGCNFFSCYPGGTGFLGTIQSVIGAEGQSLKTRPHSPKDGEIVA